MRLRWQWAHTLHALFACRDLNDEAGVADAQCVAMAVAGLDAECRGLACHALPAAHPGLWSGHCRMAVPACMTAGARRLQNAHHAEPACGLWGIRAP